MNHDHHSLLHELRNGLGRLSACTELLELRKGGLSSAQEVDLGKMKTIIAEMASVAGAIEGALEEESDEGPNGGVVVNVPGSPSCGVACRRGEDADNDPADSPDQPTTQPRSTARTDAAKPIRQSRDGTPPNTPRTGRSNGSAVRIEGPSSVRVRIGSGPVGVASHTLESVYAVGGTSTVSAIPDDASLPGSIVAGTYRIRRQLGRGGMGSVWLARDTRLSRDVALKLVDHAMWGGLDARKVFLKEARAMARVKHPNVVTIHAFGDHHGVPYFVMEYVPGTSLERLIAVHELPLPFDQAISVVDQVCRGVEAIHRAGALHCDIKPGNVLIGPSFRIAVADLGLARAVGDPSALRAGTPGYVAPEVIAGEPGAPDERADIYAAGALAYALLTGVAPFTTEGVAETLKRQLDGDLEPASQVSELPTAFDAILGRALSRDPRARHPSAEVLRRELGAACDALPRSYVQTTVFVVDDDPLLCAQTCEIVSRALPGATVHAFGDGRKALAGVESLGLPDVAVVDLDMPDINGVELTAALKSHQLRAQGVDVVMLTGAGSARDWELLQRLGASGFLFKPVDEAELTTLMRRLATTDG